MSSWPKLLAYVAAALVSAVTYLALPQAWIFFGILHAIALFSLAALPFLRLPALVTLASGAAIMLASYHLPQILQLNAPLLRWLGLQSVPTVTMDLEPLFPWMGPLLLGLGTARLATRLATRLTARPTAAPSRSPRPSRTLAALTWPGRHSLLIYLVHQPILMGMVWTYTQLA